MRRWLQMLAPNPTEVLISLANCMGRHRLALVRTGFVWTLALTLGCASANDEPPLLVGGAAGSAGSSTSSGGAAAQPGGGTATTGGSPASGASAGVGQSGGGSTGGGAAGGGNAGALSGGMPSGGMPDPGSGGAGNGGNPTAGAAGIGGTNAGMPNGGAAGVTSTGGAMTGGSTANGGSAGATSAGGAGGCVENLACKLSPPPSTGDIYQDCVDRINQFLTQCACLPALTRRTDGEACADQMAEYDANNNSAHAGAIDKICQPSGSQNECPGYSSNEQVIGLCMQQMWDEGPPPTNPCSGTCYEQHGHFINMTDPSVTRVACGFFTTSTGKVWAAQNFSR